MTPETFNRLHTLRMENDAAKFAMEEMAPRFDRIKHRHENGTAPRAVVAYQLFQTPAPLATRLVALLDLQPGARVLEPSAGLGRLLDALQPFNPSEVVAVDVTPACTGELFKQNRPNVTIKQRDFLTLTTSELGAFDAVAMNPPFHMRGDIKHIKHALTMLKPGGRLVAICANGPRQREALEPLVDQWIDLPADSFKESGTGVNTAMLVINK
jgi:SAM-dependent methyltransferase